MFTHKTLKFLTIFLLIPFAAHAQKFTHPTDVVKKVKDNFSKLESYQADFSIVSERKDSKKYTKGIAYYRKGGRVNFSFTNPMNDVIVSNGKKMWVYINRLNAVTVQDLKENESGKGFFGSVTETGVISLFNRYHYSFASVEQPITLDKKQFYVLSLKEKVASGGFSEMKVFVDADTYFLSKIEAMAPSAKKVTLTLSNIQENIDLPNSLFQFTIGDTMRVVENGLTSVQ